MTPVLRAVGGTDSYGVKKFIVCGTAGILQKGIQAGHLVVPDAAVRDEGVSCYSQ